MPGTAFSFVDGIPWAIAVVGWGFTHLFSEARERRKEVRSQLDKAFEQLQKLEQDSRAFHCAAVFDVAKSTDLTSRIFMFERMIQRIKIVEMTSMDPYIIALRRGVTLQNFSKTTFVPQDASSSILLEISGAVQDLEDALEFRYSQRYPNRFPYFVFRTPR